MLSGCRRRDKRTPSRISSSTLNGSKISRKQGKLLLAVHYERLLNPFPEIEFKWSMYAFAVDLNKVLKVVAPAFMDG
jgi:hypothetical protein